MMEDNINKMTNELTRAITKLVRVLNNNRLIFQSHWFIFNSRLVFEYYIILNKHYMIK